MIQPRLLQPGDSIAIVAPGKKVRPTDVEQARTTFQRWGLNVVNTENLFSDKHSYLASTDEDRIRDFQSALNNRSIRCIFCARGGYGMTRILDRIDLSILKHDPKWIVGFSDITALHLKLAGLGIESLHAIMPAMFHKEDAASSIASLRTILFTGEAAFEVNPHKSNRTGKARGQLIGGNLSLIADSLGTPSEPDTSNKILVIEEIEEYKYKIDRMLTQLKRAGKLKDLAGLVVGHMTNILDSELTFGETIEEIVLNAVSDYNYPVVFGFPSGHENPNMAWIHGRQTILQSTDTRSIVAQLKENT